MNNIVYIGPLLRNKLVQKLLIEDIYGNSELIPFLNKVWDLKNMPAKDKRFRNLEEDINQHMIANIDYDEDFMYFTLLDIENISDRQFSDFLEEIVSPYLREDEKDQDDFVKIINSFISKVGFEMKEREYVDGYPIYKMGRLSSNTVIENKKLTEIELLEKKFKIDIPFIEDAIFEYDSEDSNIFRALKGVQSSYFEKDYIGLTIYLKKVDEWFNGTFSDDKGLMISMYKQNHKLVNAHLKIKDYINNFSDIGSKNLCERQNVAEYAVDLIQIKDKKLQVFISSTFEDLQDERQRCINAVLDAGHIPCGMELFKSGSDQITTIKKWIDQSDVYVLILGGRYGSTMPDSDISYTHWEFDYALNSNKEILSVLLSEAYLLTKQSKAAMKKNKKSIISRALKIQIILN
ncbi:hypothetical protein PWEIH_09241 [Listeria weihenstephanensis FSL R9-0317]|uniref:AbiJ-related protein n=1 Tax=Listeria weihenstephanensis TaxID=1006155 RepID=UPI0003E86D1F|nr:DUF4062 domain-containing protein [Listeria weihenstephanensis]EUJ38640.1 hypothetical protein PWEIH_09241 [Listeria weihenstephanensis FSL R9-0317]